VDQYISDAFNTHLCGPDRGNLNLDSSYRVLEHITRTHQTYAINLWKGKMQGGGDKEAW